MLSPRANGYPETCKINLVTLHYNMHCKSAPTIMQLPHLRCNLGTSNLGRPGKGQRVPYEQQWAPRKDTPTASMLPRTLET